MRLLKKLQAIQIKADEWPEFIAFLNKRVYLMLRGLPDNNHESKRGRFPRWKNPRSDCLVNQTGDVGKAIVSGKWAKLRCFKHVNAVLPYVPAVPDENAADSNQDYDIEPVDNLSTQIKSGSYSVLFADSLMYDCCPSKQNKP